MFSWNLQWCVGEQNYEDFKAPIVLHAQNSFVLLEASYNDVSYGLVAHNTLDLTPVSPVVNRITPLTIEHEVSGNFWIQEKDESAVLMREVSPGVVVSYKLNYTPRTSTTDPALYLSPIPNITD